jgi:hypothetical protein
MNIAGHDDSLKNGGDTLPRRKDRLSIAAGILKGRKGFCQERSKVFAG